ncbi:hypothetical protein D3C87_1455200 [compost metagenome]
MVANRVRDGIALLVAKIHSGEATYRHLSDGVVSGRNMGKGLHGRLSGIRFEARLFPNPFRTFPHIHAQPRAAELDLEFSTVETTFAAQFRDKNSRRSFRNRSVTSVATNVGDVKTNCRLPTLESSALRDSKA